MRLRKLSRDAGEMLRSLLLLWACSVAVLAHTIDIPAAETATFFEDLRVEDKMTVTYQTAGGGHLDIDFILKGPGGKVMADQRRQVTGTYSFTAEVDGRYHYSFSNEFSTVTGKTLRFDPCSPFRQPTRSRFVTASTCTESCTSRTMDTPHR